MRRRAADRLSSGRAALTRSKTDGRHVTAFLKDLAVAPEITHQLLDTIPTSRTVDYVRALMVEHGALPWRDETKIRHQRWADQAVRRRRASSGTPRNGLADHCASSSVSTAPSSTRSPEKQAGEDRTVLTCGLWGVPSTEISDARLDNSHQSRPDTRNLPPWHVA